MAAVPVLDKKPLMMPVTSITETISCRSVLANRVTMPPTLLAMPVSKKAPPMTNMATNRIRLLSTKPAKASLGLSTPVRTSTIRAIMDVTARGSFSVTNRMMTSTSKVKVMAMGDIMFSPPLFSINPARLN